MDPTKPVETLEEYFVTKFKGRVRLLANAWPMLFTTEDKARAEVRGMHNVGIEKVQARNFDLARCSIDGAPPENID